VAKEVGQGIRDALVAQDYELVGKIIGASLQYFWKLALSAMAAEWSRFIDNMGSRVYISFMRDMVQLKAWVGRNLTIKDDADVAKTLENDLRHLDIQEEIKGNLAAQKHAERMANLANAGQLELEALRKLTEEAKGKAAKSVYAETVKQIWDNPEFQKNQKVVRDAYNKQTEGLTAAGGGLGSVAFLAYDATSLKDPSKYFQPYGKGTNTIYGLEYMLGNRYFGDDFHKVDKAGQHEMLRTHPETKPVIEAFEAMAKIAKAAGQGKPGDYEFGLGWGLRMFDVYNEPGRVAKKEDQVKIPMSLDPRVIEMSDRIKKEMMQGIWGGQQVNQYNRFFEKLALLEQGHYGPMGNRGVTGALFGFPGGPGSVLNKEQYEFGIFEEYTNLKKLIGVGQQPQYPRAMFRGSTEAQDAVNKAQYETKSVQEEVRDTLRQALIVQEQQKEYAKQVVAELRAMRGDPAAPNGLWRRMMDGGDF
jgi:hypothetical protein